MVKKLFVALLMLQGLTLQAQEVLLPLQAGPEDCRPAVKGATQPLALPFFDDFAAPVAFPSQERWLTGGGATLTPGAGLLPPTVGVATLDAIDARGLNPPDAVLDQVVHHVHIVVIQVRH